MVPNIEPSHLMPTWHLHTNVKLDLQVYVSKTHPSFPSFPSPTTNPVFHPDIWVILSASIAPHPTFTRHSPLSNYAQNLTSLPLSLLAGQATAILVWEALDMRLRAVSSLLTCRNHALKVKITCCLPARDWNAFNLTQSALFPSQPIIHPSFPCQLSLSHICLVHTKHQSQPLPQGLCHGSSLFPTPGYASPIVLSRICSKVTKEALLLPYKSRLPAH